MMKNKYKIVGDTLIVYNRKDNREMLFDAEDFDLINTHTWCIAKFDNRDYAITGITTAKGNYKTLLSHRMLMNEPIDMLVDHINTDGLDNRKSNLRIATDQVNQHNRKSNGYSWAKHAKKYKVRIKLNNKSIHVGYYNTEDEARAAYLEAKKKYHPTAPHHLFV